MSEEGKRDAGRRNEGGGRELNRISPRVCRFVCFYASSCRVYRTVTQVGVRRADKLVSSSCLETILLKLRLVGVLLMIRLISWTSGSLVKIGIDRKDHSLSV
jgi:hypothetical protein